MSRINVSPVMLHYIDANASAAQHSLPMLSPETYPHMREMAEQVADGSHDGLLDVGCGLEAILDGLERLLEASNRGR